jgi:hypothetical protein
MSMTSDRLYELLPEVYRARDAVQGWPLRALLGVISEQANLVEADIAQLYENWFIETCQDWVVPYLGDLIGYRPIHEAGEPGDVSAEGVARNKILIPRRDVADTIRNRRRKGTLALLEELAADVAGWPARAVEFFRLLGWTQHLDHQRPARGQTANLRNGLVLDGLDGPFDEVAHTVDVRRINSGHTPGLYNIPSVGLFVWRLKTYSVPRLAPGSLKLKGTPAYCLEEAGPQCFTFSVLGNDTSLYVRPQPEDVPTDIAGKLNLPVPIRRRDFEAGTSDYYGEDQSLAIWADWPPSDSPSLAPSDNIKLVPLASIVAADLRDWEAYRPTRDSVAVDPVLGRILFPSDQLPGQVRVAYNYAFSADIGGGDYARALEQPAEFRLYRVGEGEQFSGINAALGRWKEDNSRNAVIEITDSNEYVEPLMISLLEDYSLQIRAANGQRPVIRLLDWKSNQPDALAVEMASGSRVTLDGLLITGRGVHIRGKGMAPTRGAACRAQVSIRHCTLVPGWGLHWDCGPKRPAESSLRLFNVRASVRIEHSIVGSIQINENPVTTDPIPLFIADSIVDAVRSDREAVGAPGYDVAHAVLTIKRCTVFGIVNVHAIASAENCIFNDCLNVARRQLGCMRFCYVPPGCRTPRRYGCQPDLVDRAVEERLADKKDQWTAAKDAERTRVRPRFNSERYGTPTYCQLAHTCADEIKRGADDESEMGVFHDLYQPQREANLRARLDEYAPAGMDAGIIYVS